MVSTVFNGEFRAAPRRNPLHALRAAWQGFLQRRADRLALERAALRGPQAPRRHGVRPRSEFVG